MTKTFSLDESKIVRDWIRQHAEAYNRGNFGKANIIRNKLERLGVEGDFECNFEPEKQEVEND